MNNKNPLLEGSIGDAIKLKYAHLKYKYPRENEWKSTPKFWESYRRERKEAADKLKAARLVAKFDSKGHRKSLYDLQDKLLNNKMRSVRRFEREHGKIDPSQEILFWRNGKSVFEFG